MKVVMKSILWSCALSLCVACNSTSENAKNQNLIIHVASVKSQDVDNRKEFSFLAKPYRTSDLSFRVGGPIERFDVYAGNYYKKGDVIAEVDSRDFLIRKERAEAIYHQSKAEFERIGVLFEKNNISASAYEKAKADYTSAKTAFETAKNELDDAKLIAPFNGYVGEVYIEKYQDVKATQPVVSLVDIDQLKIEAYVTQDIALGARDMKEVNLCFDAIPGEVYVANVVEVSKSTTKNNLSYLLTALLPNKDGKLLAGMSGKVFFDVVALSSLPIVTIPQTALCHRPTEGSYVWVVNAGTQQVSRRKVEVGALQPNGSVCITTGVNVGEIIAVSGLRFLSEGMKVETAKGKNAEPTRNTLSK